MRPNYTREISKHVETHYLSYFFIMILLVMGLIFGAVIVITMHFTQKQDLLFYLNQYFSRVDSQSVLLNSDLLRASFFSHFQFLLIIFILGLTIVGLPIIWVMIFIKGTFIGFSIGFFVNQYGLRGLLFVSAGVLPQNLILIPLYILSGSIAMIFSSYLLKRLMSKRLTRFTWQGFAQYGVAFVILITFSLLAALVEAYFSSFLIEYVSSVTNL
ncbi:stage II sporulation protein M [Amphibacillus marinus]|uniref:Stage II sporulation protein M n=1 Tax=Amphibacillus marinus TaxID=872970 RepID=A0A1H8G9P1_9BACI|nr:stage II sporulation protein M [Amphibacillus marinus]SEN40841.1 stage II sporulation protein M [Amphibacillus marinus]